MARNVIRSNEAAAPPAAPGEQAPLPGGTSGAPPDPNPPCTRIAGIDDVTPARDLPDPVTPLRRMYRVAKSPEMVVYAGGRVRMPVGKLYPEGTVDFDVLQRQGVVFEEVATPGGAA